MTADETVPDRARAHARPVAGRKLPGGRVADRLSRRSADLVGLLDAQPPGSAVDPRTVRSHELLLVTFRRNGDRVATPVWAATADGVVYVRTQRASGKVKRLRRNGNVLLAPCGPRGVPRCAPVAGRARLLPAAEEPVAERALRARYGPVRALCARIQDLLRVDMCYLAVTVEPGEPR
ncbi:PPOX class F420-dependent oxidoreductase [Amycolatopsis sp. cmx-4-61]|uniref:PPOX class F420-dependent oxidoreductase n=1 Tax=Amycolatopsis sp. cmx-4-61 TaxID=2790937 RepID=UPI0039799438